MLGVADYGSFVVAVIVFLMIPGPGNLALITSTGKGGVRGGLGATLGVIAGDQVLMWLAVAGVAALLAAWPPAFYAVQWLGAAYLAWLGVRMILARPGDAPVLHILPHHYFRQALAITLLNPKAIVFYMAFFPLFVDPARHRGLLTFGVMAATIAALTFVYGLVVVLLTHRLAEGLRATAGRRARAEPPGRPVPDRLRRQARALALNAAAADAARSAIGRDPPERAFALLDRGVRALVGADQATARDRVVAQHLEHLLAARRVPENAGAPAPSANSWNA